jgi:hypothetical protein
LRHRPARWFVLGRSALELVLGQGLGQGLGQFLGFLGILPDREKLEILHVMSYFESHSCVFLRSAFCVRPKPWWLLRLQGVYRGRCGPEMPRSTPDQTPDFWV